MAHHIEALIGLLAVVALVAWAARAAGLPYPIVLVMVGFGLGYVPGAPATGGIDPDVVFLVFVPPLVHAAGYSSSLPRLREMAGEIALLAIGLVAVTIVAVALVAHALVDGMTWEAAVVLGAVVAPTDPVAATAVFRRLGAPQRVVAIVDGEALVNDASALVVYRIAIGAAVAGTFSLLHGAGELISVSAGGVAVGLAAAALAAWIRRRLDDSLIEITVTLLTPYLAYIGAEELGVSGILASVTSGIVVARMATQLFSPGTRLEAYAFWNFFTFLLEATLFIIIGLQVPDVLDRVDGSIVGAAIGVSAAAVAVRLAYALLIPRLRLQEKLVVGWTGMRGAVSLAAALAVPVATDSGAPFPARDEILFLTLCVIGVTLVGQGLTLPLVARGIVSGEHAVPAPRQKALARFQIVEDALERISELALDGSLAAPLLERARELYTQRASQLAGECRTGVAEEQTDTAAWIRLRLELLEAERRALEGLRDRGEAAPDVVRDINQDLDLEATRLQSRLPAAA